MEDWKIDLLKNPPPAAKMYSVEEWEHMVLNEFICDPRKDCNIGEANGYWGKKHPDYVRADISSKVNAYISRLSKEERKTVFGLPGEKNSMYGRDRSGENNPMYGKQQSSETKQKISEKAIGRIPSQEARLKMAKAQTARWDEESKKDRSKRYKELGIKPPSPKGMLWWNDGINVLRSKTSPGENWVRGRKIG
jgi:hypothetical protein